MTIHALPPVPLFDLDEACHQKTAAPTICNCSGETDPMFTKQLQVAPGRKGNGAAHRFLLVGLHVYTYDATGQPIKW